MRLVSALLIACSITAAESAVPLPIPEGDTLVLGIVGGWVDWDDPEHAVRRTALALRSVPGLWVETVENHSLEVAQELIVEAFDRDQNGSIDEAERSRVRLQLYGHSLGGRATLRLCRWLHERRIPVELAVVVDAFGRDSYVVPPNVARVANLYQRDRGFVKGARELHPEDPQRTVVVGNWRYSYRDREVETPGKDVLTRWFFGSHLKMEFDPEPWERVQELVASAATGRDMVSVNRGR